jgi:hypothetical protein
MSPTLLSFMISMYDERSFQFANVFSQFHSERGVIFLAVDKVALLYRFFGVWALL